jgi:hypothetical protein
MFYGLVASAKTFKTEPRRATCSVQRIPFVLLVQGGEERRLTFREFDTHGLKFIKVADFDDPWAADAVEAQIHSGTEYGLRGE